MGGEGASNVLYARGWGGDDAHTRDAGGQGTKTGEGRDGARADRPEAGPEKGDKGGKSEQRAIRARAGEDAHTRHAG